MFAVLWHYGIPEAVVNAIRLLFKKKKQTTTTTTQKAL